MRFIHWLFGNGGLLFSDHPVGEWHLVCWTTDDDCCVARRSVMVVQLCWTDALLRSLSSVGWSWLSLRCANDDLTRTSSRDWFEEILLLPRTLMLSFPSPPLPEYLPHAFIIVQVFTENFWSGVFAIFCGVYAPRSTSGEAGIAGRGLDYGVYYFQ